MTGTTRTATQRLDEYLAAIGGPTTATLAAGVLGLTRAYRPGGPRGRPGLLA